MKTLIVIPARLGSTRLPRKALLKETGRFLVQHCYEQTVLTRGAAKVVIATDDESIVTACRGFGAEVIMTSPELSSGTDRTGAAARVLESRGERYDLVLNVQGDEPEVNPRHIEALMDLMKDGAPYGTVAEPLEDPEDFPRPSIVKVVLDVRGRALYFSRAPIPCVFNAKLAPPEHRPLRHLGLYAFRRDFLDTFTNLPRAPLEFTENLEQLRALYHGYPLQVGLVTGASGRGIDTREDYDAFLLRWHRAQGR